MFDEEIKDEVLRKYFAEGYPLHELAVKYSAKDATISRWAKEYMDEYQTLEEKQLYQGLTEAQLRYILINKHRDNNQKEKYIHTNHFDIIYMLDLIIKDQQSKQFTNCAFTLNDRKLIDVYYEFWRDTNRFIRIYLLENLPLPLGCDVDDFKNVKKTTLIDGLNLHNYSFPNNFDKELVFLIYNKIDEASISRGYIDLNFYEDIVDKLIPDNLFYLRSNKAMMERDRYHGMACSSMYSLMNIMYIEYIISDYGRVDYPGHRSLRSKYLFKEIEWVDESKKIMRIYLSRLICEDKAIEDFKNKLYNENVRYIKRYNSP